ncbi:hypothetical protein ACIP88_05170 [Streptomyces uncialis]|uniref:hypothetical protein n=1 Tax=Streptomyces uncialis TaxID=1048205 RepID=UPI003829F18B
MTDTARRFKDCDGDTWTEYESGRLWLTEQANGGNGYLGIEGTTEDAAVDHGPLIEIRPDVHVRYLLADVLRDLAEDARQAFWGATDPTEERVYDRLYDLFDAKARELREGTSS